MGTGRYAPNYSSGPDHFYDISPTDAFYMGLAGEKWDAEQVNTKWANATTEAAQAMAEGNMQLAAEKQAAANYYQGISAQLTQQSNQTDQFGAETTRATGMGSLALETNKFLMDKASNPEDLFSLYYLQRGVTPDWQGIKNGTAATGDAIVPVNPMTAYKPTTAAPDFTKPLTGIPGPPGIGQPGGGTTNYAQYVDRNPAGAQGGVPLANLRPGMNLSTVGGDTTWGSDYSDAYYDVGKTKKVNAGDVITGGTKIWVDYNPTPASSTPPASTPPPPTNTTTVPNVSAQTPAMAMGGWTSGDNFGRFIAGDSLTGRPNEEMIQLSPGASARVVPLDPAHRQMAQQMQAMPRFAFGTGVPQARPGMGGGYTPPAEPARQNMGGGMTVGPNYQSPWKATPPANTGMTQWKSGSTPIANTQIPGRINVAAPSYSGGDQAYIDKLKADQAQAQAMYEAQAAKFNAAPSGGVPMAGMQPGTTFNTSFMPSMKQGTPTNPFANPANNPVANPSWNNIMAGMYANQGGAMPANSSNYQSVYRSIQPPQFALGTDASQQYGDAGMGSLWMNSSNNNYASGRELPPNMKTHMDNGMPIPPHVVDALTGGIAPTLNMGNVFSSRGIGNMPSLQAINRMTQGEQANLKGYLQSSVTGSSIPFGDFLDFLQKPTQNLQSAQRARMAG
jgi:hypothetical protein